MACDDFNGSIYGLMATECFMGRVFFAGERQAAADAMSAAAGRVPMVNGAGGGWESVGEGAEGGDDCRFENRHSGWQQA